MLRGTPRLPPFPFPSLPSFFSLQLAVFNCGPLNPPDGNLYLLVVFEVCGTPGGVQATLMPWAVLTLIFYSFGYPVFLARTFWVNRWVQCTSVKSEKGCDKVK
jgi:hypothetical protein